MDLSLWYSGQWLERLTPNKTMLSHQVVSRDVRKEGFVIVFGHEAVERGDEPRK